MHSRVELQQLSRYRTCPDNEPDDRLGDILGRAGARERGHLCIGRFDFLITLLADSVDEPTGRDQTWTDGIDANLRSHRSREMECHRIDRPLRSNVGDRGPDSE